MKHDTHEILAADTNFVIIPQWILLADISDGAVRLYGALRKYADNATMKAFPSRATLAKDIHKSSRRTIDKYLGELVSIGALKIERRKRPGTNQLYSNVYTLTSTPCNSLHHPVQKIAPPGAENCAENYIHLTKPTELDQTFVAVDQEINEKNALPPLSSESSARDNSSIEDEYGFTPEAKKAILNNILYIYKTGDMGKIPELAQMISDATGIDVEVALNEFRWDDRLFEIVSRREHTAIYNAGAWLKMLLNWANLYG